MAPRRRPPREVETPSATIRMEPIPRTEPLFNICSWDFAVILMVLAGALSFIFVHLYFYPTVEKVLSLPNIDPDSAPVTWGTYRPHMYFGLRTRAPESPLFGLMWYEQPNSYVKPSVRHWCDQNDRLPGYFWYEADGRTFGRQNITETNKGVIQTDWVNEPYGFAARVKLNMPPGTRYNFILYLSSQDTAKFRLGKHLRDIVHGHSDLLGKFTMSIRVKDQKVLHTSLLVENRPSIERYHDFVIENTQAFQDPGQQVNFLLNEKHNDKEGRFAAVQLNLGANSEFEVYFQTDKLTPMKSDEFSNVLRVRAHTFNKKYEGVFELTAARNYTPTQQKMGKVALSNMMGSLGYWYGYNRINHHGTQQSYGPHEFFSSVPSRPFFPRGFLWDEGFHQMLIRKMDARLSLEVLVSWMNAMDTFGWIPREMIVGVEAEAKVPAEFIVQKTDVANPPTLFYVMDKLINDEKTVSKYGGILKMLYPRLEKWFHWIRSSQAGPTKSTYRWRGRNETILTELNPKTLSSGLDDFPRASHPSDNEYHLDLRCWLALAARVLERLSKAYGSDWEHKRMVKISEELNNYEALVKDHWSSKHGGFFDYGKHSEDVALAPVPVPGGRIEYQKVTSRAPTYKLVTDVFGYNNLFPMLLKMIPSKSPHLKVLLDKIRDPKHLWTPYGLRSISKESPYHHARNTEHDAPYWRGYIWVNINYMVLSSLKHYSIQPGPYQQQAAEIFNELREALVANMARQFNKTGFLWENYDDRNGQGRGCHPFTGWSSLILLIMSDNLDT